MVDILTQDSEPLVSVRNFAKITGNQRHQKHEKQAGAELGQAQH